MRSLAPLALLLSVVLGACAPGGAEDASPTAQVGLFEVNTVRVEVSDAAPPEVTLEVDGALPDGCTQVGEVLQDRTGFSITVTVRTIHQDEPGCADEAATHHETIRLGVFEQQGTYTLQVNDVSTGFAIGAAAESDANPYDNPVTAPQQSSDGVLSLLGPLGWPVETGPGFLRLAATEGALYDTGVPSAARLTFTVVTGPSRAVDFHLDGRTVREVYAYFALFPESRVAAPTEALDLAWPGVEGHSRDSQAGDQHLMILGIDDQTIVAIQGYCPPGDWELFEPILRAIVESLAVS